MRSLLPKLAAATTIGLVGLVGLTSTPAQAVSTYHGCPPGYVCVYPGTGYNNDKPSLKFEAYGNHNLSYQYGLKRLVNNQTGGAWDYECSGYGGTGSTIDAGTGFSETVLNFTPINSIRLTASYSPCSG